MSIRPVLLINEHEEPSGSKSLSCQKIMAVSLDVLLCCKKRPNPQSEECNMK